MTHEKRCGGSGDRPENDLPTKSLIWQKAFRLFVATLVANEPTSSRFGSSIPGSKNDVFLPITNLAGTTGTAWSLSIFLTQKTATL